jgi:predicted LPLAT superfamily acyltransferase
MTSDVFGARTLEGHQWAQLPERGTPGSVRTIMWIARHLGRRVARLLLYPITFYFLLTAGAAREASRQYLRRLHSRRAGWWQLFCHFHCFAATILDRVYLLKGQFDCFDITLHGKDTLIRQMESGKGCLLLGSHLGSFEVLRTLGVSLSGFPLRVLMDIEHNPNITRLLDALNPDIANTVIQPDQPDTLLKVKESLDAGFFIGVLGDRVSKGDKTTECRFLGASAIFPAGPVLLAAIMNCPVILFFGLYRGGNRYEIHFEYFAQTINLNRDRRTEEIRVWTQRYVERLEHYARLAPYNWFNFFPFWD